MSILLGWIAVVLAGPIGASPPKAPGPEIAYQFQIVEMNGLEWRAAANSKLRVISQRGSTTLWTAPRNLLASLPQGCVGNTLMTPRVTACSQAPAHVTTRKPYSYVATTSWKEGESTPQGKTRIVREGVAATIAGRKLDQGVLVQLVLEATDVRAVHTVKVPAPGGTCQSATKTAHTSRDGQELHAGSKDHQIGVVAFEIENITFHTSSDAAHDKGCDASCPAPGHQAKDSGAKKASWEPVGVQGCCEVSVEKSAACSTGKPVEHTECCAGTCAKAGAQTAQIEVPEVVCEEISGEWLIAPDEVLVVSFGPHTVADKDGKAVVRERLALVTAQPVDAPAELVLPGNLPTAMPKVAPPRTAAAPMPMPAIPGRTLPQGIHPDGTPAPLPPLPEEEKASDTPADSAEPRPSPQTKKPHHPASHSEKSQQEPAGESKKDDSKPSS
jgi:hypothetical protein